jgi:hypothetical protein
MAKGKRARGAKKRVGPSRDRRAERLEKALAAGLKREAKAASRLEAAQLEVAVLRAALAEVLGDEPGDVPPAPAEVPPAPQKAPLAPEKAPPEVPPAPAATGGPAASATSRIRRAPRRSPVDR